MTTFDDREKGAEAIHAHEHDQATLEIIYDFYAAGQPISAAIAAMSAHPAMVESVLAARKAAHQRGEPVRDFRVQTPEPIEREDRLAHMASFTRPGDRTVVGEHTAAVAATSRGDRSPAG